MKFRPALIVAVLLGLVLGFVGGSALAATGAFAPPCTSTSNSCMDRRMDAVEAWVKAHDTTPTPTPTPTTSTTTSTTTPTPPPTSTSTTSTTTTPATTTTTTQVPAPPPPAASSATPILDYYGKWTKGPRVAAGDFPIGVWLQDPTRASDTITQWKNLGVNTYVGIWSWPTDAGAYPGHAQAMLDAFKAAGAQASAYYDDTTNPTSTQLEAGRNGDTIRAHVLEDEPDMKGMTAAQLAAKASKAHSGDPSRPTFVNFSKGIVDGWNNGVWLTLNDRKAYCASADIASVDYYGFTDPWMGRPGATAYAEGIDALRAACGNDKPLWGFVETTRPFDSVRITADQFEVAVWTMLAAGADGVELFVHDIPAGWEDALLRDSAAAAVKTRVGVVTGQIRAVSGLLHQADAPASSDVAMVRVLGKTGGWVATNMATSAQTATLTTPCGQVTVTLPAYGHRTATC